ncbi:MAG: response regulator [Leptospiraceae bacterium]|nr:response regulator [Leptospiraceae bacterium]MCP5513097.1 response regulator [Leptospiraceae bacterium]
MLLYIIDDNQTNLILFEQIAKLAAPEEKIKTFLDPSKALNDFESEKPDLVIIDYMMPDIDGIEFIKKIKKFSFSKEIPIIMVTAATDKEIRHRALDVGVTDFLTKPIDPLEVKTRLINLLALRRLHLRQKDLNVWLSDEILKATETIVSREEELVMRLAKAAEYRDPETGGHIQRMSHYSRVISEKLGMDKSYNDLIQKAAPMHDIGKLGIPDGILLKPGKLTYEEMEIMKLHSSIGSKILENSNSKLIQMGAEIALSHHEKWDGSGYPSGRKGEEIPISARIVAVADVFDALTSERPYKKAWKIEDAIGLLKENRNTHFDSKCVDVFLESIETILEIKSRFKDTKTEITKISEFDLNF